MPADGDYRFLVELKKSCSTCRGAPGGEAIDWNRQVWNNPNFSFSKGSNENRPCQGDGCCAKFFADNNVPDWADKTIVPLGSQWARLSGANPGHPKYQNFNCNQYGDNGRWACQTKPTYVCLYSVCQKTPIFSWQHGENRPNPHAKPICHVSAA